MQGDLPMLNNLEDICRDVAVACRRRDLPLPMIVCAASRNGSFLVIRIGAKETSVLAERIEDNGFSGQFKVMLLDQSGKAVQLAVNGAKNSRPLPRENGRRRRASSRGKSEAIRTGNDSLVVA